MNKFFLLLSFALCTFANAQEETKTDKIKLSDEIVTFLYKKSIEEFETEFRSIYMPEEVAVIQSDLTKSTKELKSKIVKKYVSFYTLSELKGLHEFYSSDLGIKFMDQSSRISIDFANMLQDLRLKMHDKLSIDN